MSHSLTLLEQTNGWSGGVGPLSEQAVLALIDEVFPSRTEHLPLGRGHDCAVLEHSSPLALSTDLFLEDVHFSRRYFSPEEAGAKALASAVSDLAAAGAAPLAFSLGLILPPGAGEGPVRALLAGMAASASTLDIALSGGDLSRGERFGMSVTVWGGPCVDDAPLFRRVNARPGHCLFLVGCAGLARVGLWALERHGRKAIDEWPEACRAHLCASPLLAEGQTLARFAREEEEAARKMGRAGPNFSLMDVSDGLVADLPRLLGPLGADLDLAPDMIPNEVRKAAPLMDSSPEEVVLLGGEDYALVGTCPTRLWPMVCSRLPTAKLLGTVREVPGISLNGQDLSLRGFDHFLDISSSTGAARSLPAVARNSAAELALAGREAWKAGLMAGFNGNLSCRLRLGSGREACLITRAGAAKARLSVDDLCLLDLDEGTLLAGPQPSTESAVHLGIYRACPESRVVLHVHPPCLLAVSLACAPEERLNLPLPEAERYQTMMAWTPFFPPGSAELGQAVAKAAGSKPAIWMERHGLVIHGPDLTFALALAEELEQLARVRLATPKFSV
ncbi:class II aldolase/adducin family protein [Desulfovibrio sp. OttesenSCG-928-M16]|nr:class II aldolase/adducin family protein [Desulfovibrio sp. OttesenSCG-928-M16]